MEKSKQMTMVSTIATINNSKIVVIENGEKRVAIKPICEALGIDPDKQNQRIKEDEILSELHAIRYVVAADGKQREMSTIPFKYVFGWLFSINTKKVAPEAKVAMVRYKKECYDALYNHFTLYAEFVDYKQTLTEQKREEMKAARFEFSNAKNKLKDAEDAIDDAIATTIGDYKQQKAQLQVEFPEHEKGGTS